MAHQLRVWGGEFGKAYADLSLIDWRMQLPAIQQIVGGLASKRVLEVWCNRGHKLVALADLLPGDRYGCAEPNRYALEFAAGLDVKVDVLYSNAFDWPFKDRHFYCVFTIGVLIHIHFSDLPVALTEIYVVSKFDDLAIEYFAAGEVVIHCRGEDDLYADATFSYTTEASSLV